MEAATELVAQATVGHRVERSTRDEQRPRVAGRDVASKQVFDGHRLRELGCTTPAAVRPVERGLDGRRRRVEQHLRRTDRPGLEPCVLDEPRHEPATGGLDLDALLAPGAIDPFEHLVERRHPVARFVREVGAAVERPAIGGQEDRHRPAAATSHRLDRRHVDLVEVGTLLAIDLDRDEPLVEVPRRRFVLERFAFHDVTPVTRRIADGQEDRPVQQPRSRECVGSPGVPIHRILGVLEEVRTGLPGQAVGHDRMVPGVGAATDGAPRHRERQMKPRKGLIPLVKPNLTALSCTSPHGACPLS